MGQIPNSINIPAPAHLVQEDGTIKPENEIRELYQEKGVDLAKPIVFSCGGGIMASMAYACLKQANVETDIYLYDGSWSEYEVKKAKEDAATT